MFSTSHEQLIEKLRSQPELPWEGQALLRCLERLRDGGPTLWRDVTMVDAWLVADGFCLVYDIAADRIGARVHRWTGSGPPFFFDRDVFGADPDPSAFAVEIADYSIAEPLGTFAKKLVRDSAGVGWWGDPPLPGVRN